MFISFFSHTNKHDIVRARKTITVSQGST